MTKFFGYIILFLIFFIPILLYRNLYFRPITMIQITSSGLRCVSLRPCRRFLSDIVGIDYARVPLRPGYVAFYNPMDMTEGLSFDDRIDFGTTVLIVSVRRGRFVSSSLSDRSVVELISKFH